MSLEKEHLDLDDLLGVTGGASYDSFPPEKIEEFKAEAARFKKLGIKKEFLISAIRLVAQKYNLSEEQLTIVLDLLNDCWDSL